MEFMGYVRPDGKVGARNYVAVIPSVTCANDVANAICHQVQGTITYLHHQGCCQMPPDLERVTDTLISLGMSPNVGAILIVSLGCEGTDHERMYKELSATGKRVRSSTFRSWAASARRSSWAPILPASLSLKFLACSASRWMFPRSLWPSSAVLPIPPAAWLPTVLSAM